MGIVGAYLDLTRQAHRLRPAAESVADFGDIVIDLPLPEQLEQAGRCMACGVPFCQSGLRFNAARQASGCPLHNLIPETNDLLCRGRLSEAAARLALTNPFPEFTGRVCPAPCETACNLGLNFEAVTIHDNERAISDYQWGEGIEPLPRAAADAPLVSVIGSGPAGLACAWELARRGMRVRVYDRDELPGGLLMFGIPAMKLPKEVVLRRIRLMEDSGIEFVCGADATGFAAQIMEGSDAVVLAVGARKPRSLDVPGADLDGVCYAVDYLSEATRALLDGREPSVNAAGLDVVVIGGGDTGTDCIATALRQGAASVRQVIRASEPPAEVDAHTAWPAPVNRRTLPYGQREAAELLGADPRLWSTDTCGFTDDGAGCVAGVQTAAIPSGGDEQELPAQLVLIAKGFTGPEHDVLAAFGLGEDGAPPTPCPVHLCGDARTGSSIVASAIADGLQTAAAVAEELASAM